MSKLIAAITNPNTPWGKLTEGEESKLPQFFGNMLQAVLVIAALLTLFYLIWGGIDWLTAEGDAEKLTAARKKLINAVVGLILLTAVWAIWQAIANNFLGIDMNLPTP